MNKNLLSLLALLVIIVILFIVYTFSMPSSPVTSTLYVQITDPPTVPAGTQILNISYSSIQVHVTGSSSAWITSNLSGTVDILRLVNLTETVSRLDIPLNSTVDTVRIRLYSANITINGTTYPVTLPDRVLSANLSAGSALNGASILLDLSPTVITIFASNSTLFIMVPSAKAIIITGSKLGSSGVGSIAPLSIMEKAELNSTGPSVTITNATGSYSNGVIRLSLTLLDNSASSVVLRHLLLSGSVLASINTTRLNTANPSAINLPSINISAVSSLLRSINLSIIGSIFNKTVAAQGSTKSFVSSSNQSLSQVLNNIIGAIESTLNSSSAIRSQILSNSTIMSELRSLFNATNPKIGSLLSGLNTTQSSGVLKSLIANVTNASYANSLSGANLSVLKNRLSAKLSGGTTLNTTGLSNIINTLTRAEKTSLANRAHAMVSQENRLRVINFIIERNGTLVLPSSASQLNSTGYGYSLPAGRSVTLSFTGRVTLGNGIVALGLLHGGSYGVVVTGEQGARASKNLTAN